MIGMERQVEFEMIDLGSSRGWGKEGEGGREAGGEGRERVHRDNMRLWAE